MKKLFILSMLIFSAMFIWTGCMKDRITGAPASIAFMENVRKLYVDKEIVIKRSDLQEATSISGVVISDPQGGNAPEGLVVLQNTRGNTTRGIALNLGDQAGNYYLGDQLIVRIEGKKLNRVNGILQILDVKPADIEVKAVGQIPQVALVTSTVPDIVDNMNRYESTLVQLKTAIPDNADAGHTFLGNRTITDWANPIVFHTRSTAEFANTLIPAMGDYTGIAFFHTVNGEVKPTIQMRNNQDFVGMPLIVRNPGALYSNFPEGWEDETIPGHLTAVAANATDTYPSGEWLFHRMNRNGGSTIGRRPPIPPATAARGLLMQVGQEAILAMNFNLPYGVKKLSFYCGPATTTDTNVGEFSVEYSTNSGTSWTELDRFSGYRPASNASPNLGGIPFNRDLADPLNYKEYVLDIQGSVRFRFIQHSAGRSTGSRWTVDDIAVYQND